MKIKLHNIYLVALCIFLYLSSCTFTQVDGAKGIEKEIEGNIINCIFQENSMESHYDETLFEAVEKIDSYLVSNQYVDGSSKSQYIELLSSLINNEEQVFNDSFFIINGRTLDHLTNPVYFSTLYNCFWYPSMQLQIDSLEFVSTLPGQVAAILDDIVEDGSYRWDFVVDYFDLLPQDRFNSALYKSFIIHITAVFSTRLHDDGFYNDYPYSNNDGR